MRKPFFHHVCVHGATPKFAAAAQKLTEAVLWIERAPSAVELSIHFVQPSQMHSLNYECRGIDKPTDVLTFPGSGSGTSDVRLMNDVILGNSNFSFKEKENDNDGDYNNIKTDLQIFQLQRRTMLMDLGEIYFSVEYIWQRCLHQPGRNLPFHSYLQAALIHAVLHALGYDHDTADEWKRMSRREKFMMHQLNAYRRRCPGYLPELDGMEIILSSTRP
ncbi:putative rRNA maturation factor [Trypanosoma theileri]|uniref:Putative rRNA maturation factor n=1 Tax=Trypanosoma theileri TaxID=67003 RepID=A0A1X0PA77_9TRYP|nr:putative rRNA maturation factor [Trypanosoma theileri]ORC93731.1 putative rRNA maturation factor [Trypanosoma theileri]